MHDTLYANQGAENSDALSDPHLFAFAKNIGLDTTKFNDCFSSGKYSSKVTQDGLDATKAGIQSTPSFLINGKLIAGAQPFSQFQKEIDAALAAAKK
ncbi:MAG TPA: thioredoxin domain-containing protein, partial [bacterium]